MRQLSLLLACLLAVVLPSLAEEKIYRSTDAEGNPVFSSTPPTPDAREIEVGPTNSAEAVKVRPAAPEPARTERAARSGTPAAGDIADEDSPTVIGGDDNHWDDLIYDDVRDEDRLQERQDRPRVNPLPAPARRAAGGRR